MQRAGETNWECERKLEMEREITKEKAGAIFYRFYFTLRDDITFPSFKRRPDLYFYSLLV